MLSTVFTFFYDYSFECPCVHKDSAACVKW